LSLIAYRVESSRIDQRLADRKRSGLAMSDEQVHVYWHPDCLGHDAGRGCYEYEPSPLMAVDEPHPDTPERILNIRSILERGPIATRMRWQKGRAAQRSEVERFHLPAYVDEVLEAGAVAPVRIDGSGTVVGPGTLSAVFAAAGCALEALDAVLSDRRQRAYALVRPPGHHAGRGMADGNCIFNNLAIAVEAALARGVRRIAIVDWDVHHGNGTQSGFYDRSEVLSVSIHMPLGSWGPNHPELGTVEEAGVGAGAGFNLNLPLPYGSGDLAYERVMRELVVPAVDAFEPELLCVACGLDANQFDPNGRNLLSMRGFRTLGRITRELADRHCGGRVLLTQEGGYAVTYTGFCMYAVMEGLLGIEEPMPDPLAYGPEIEQPSHPIATIAAFREAWRDAVRRAGGRVGWDARRRARARRRRDQKCSRRSPKLSPGDLRRIENGIEHGTI
jgi:acetoin utilization deacetylase AcuC-like enzyme